MKLQIKAVAPEGDLDPQISLLGSYGDFSIMLEGVDITKAVKKLTLDLAQDDWTMAVLEVEVGELEINVDGDVFLKASDGPTRQNVTALNHKLSQLRIKEEFERKKEARENKG